MNLVELLLAHAAPPDAPAVREGRDTVTHGELAARAARFAGALRARGVGPHDRVALVAPNGIGFVVAYLGALHRGAAVAPLNPHAPRPELAREIAAVDARLVVTGSEVAVEAAADRPVVAVPEARAVLDGGEPIAVEQTSDDDPAALLFTSGTAGPSKAAVLTHGSLAANLRQVLGHPGLALTADDVALGVLPFFHVFGLNVALGVPLAAGASVVVVADFDPHATLALLAEEGVTVVAGVPSMFRAWLEVPDAPPEAFAGVRLAVSGAAALPEEIAAAFRERFGVVLHQGYGLTEASPIVTTTALVDDPRAGSIGPPLPGVEVRLVDADGSDVLVGDPGEIWVRGPNVFAGYWDDPEATARARTPEGWLRTGDVAVADVEGVLSLVDRTKDVIIVSGFNVYPAEVEDALRQHPHVVDAAVVGEPHERTGESVVAYVVPAPGTTPDPDELRSAVAGQLARYKCPSRVELVEALPRTAVGKVLRRELRDEGPATPSATL